MKKLLISGLGGSLFPYLHHKLSKKYVLYYVDSDEYLEKLYPELNFFLVPNVTEIKYFEIIKKLIVKFHIDYYIPLIDEELVNAILNLEGYNGVKVVTPNLDFCTLCLNKFQLMKTLKNKEISNINSFIGSEFKWEINTPIFIKPISGRGSRGIKKIISNEQLQAYYDLECYKPNEVLIQENIEGTEYTIGAVVNNLNQLLSVSIKKVIRKKRNYSNCCY